MGWLEEFLDNAQRQRTALATAAQTGGTLAPPDPADNIPRIGGLADDNPLHRPDDATQVHLGKGVRHGPLHGSVVDSPFERYMVRRKGKALEAHDYGQGNVKYFARKNPAILEAAAKLAEAQHGERAPLTAATDQVRGLAPADQERIRFLLGY